MTSWKCHQLKKAEIENSSNKNVKKSANLLALRAPQTTIKLDKIVQKTCLKTLDINQTQISAEAFIHKKLLNSR